MPVQITWLGHASVMVGRLRTVYIDPWKTGADRPKRTSSSSPTTTTITIPTMTSRLLPRLHPDTRPAPPLVTDMISPGETMNMGVII